VRHALSLGCSHVQREEDGAVALIVMDVLTCPSGSPSSRTVMSARLEMGTPTRPTSAVRLGRVRVVAIWVGRSKAPTTRSDLFEEVSEPAVWSPRPWRTPHTGASSKPAAVHRRLDARVDGYSPGRPRSRPRPDRRYLPVCTGRGPPSPTVFERFRAAPGALERFRANSSRQRSRPGSTASPIGRNGRSIRACPRARRAVASHSSREQRSPTSTSGRRSPHRDTTPPRDARSSFCIFIASMTRELPR